MSKEVVKNLVHRVDELKLEVKNYLNNSEITVEAMSEIVDELDTIITAKNEYILELEATIDEFERGDRQIPTKKHTHYTITKRKFLGWYLYNGTLQENNSKLYSLGTDFVGHLIDNEPLTTVEHIFERTTVEPLPLSLLEEFSDDTSKRYKDLDEEHKLKIKLIED